MKDYSKIKALASQILECIGDEPEGGDGTSISHSEDERGDVGETGLSALKPAATEGCPSCDDTEGSRKKRKDDAIAMMASTLASKFNKK